LLSVPHSTIRIYTEKDSVVPLYYSYVSDAASTPVDGCVLIHDHALKTVRNREAVASMVDALPVNSKLQVTVVGSRETTVLTATVTGGKHSFKEAVLEWVPASDNGPELSATFLNRGLEQCYTDHPLVAGELAKISIIVGSSDTDVVGDNEPLLNKKVKTFVMNVTPGMHVLPTFSLLATDEDHVIDIADLAAFSKVLQFGAYT